jgi:hypothetical protein
VTHRRALILVCLALVAIVLLGLGLSACGGAKMYTNPTYGYSFSYPGDWTVKPATSDVTAGGSISASMAAYNPQGTQVQGNFVDFAQVAVYPLNSAVTDPWSSSMRAEMEGLLNSLESRTPDVKVEEALKQTTTAGLKGYGIIYTFTKDGTPMRSVLYFLFDRTREYELNEQAAVTAWDRTKPELDNVIGTFKPGEIK